jgi:hypothetical protein
VLLLEPALEILLHVLLDPGMAVIVNVAPLLGPSICAKHCIEKTIANKTIECFCMGNRYWFL